MAHQVARRARPTVRASTRWTPPWRLHRPHLSVPRAPRGTGRAGDARGAWRHPGWGNVAQRRENFRVIADRHSGSSCVTPLPRSGRATGRSPARARLAPAPDADEAPLASRRRRRPPRWRQAFDGRPAGALRGVAARVGPVRARVGCCNSSRTATSNGDDRAVGRGPQRQRGWVHRLFGRHDCRYVQ